MVIWLRFFSDVDVDDGIDDGVDVDDGVNVDNGKEENPDLANKFTLSCNASSITINDPIKIALIARILVIRLSW